MNDATLDYDSVVFARSFAHEARRQQASRLRNVGRGHHGCGDAGDIVDDGPSLGAIHFLGNNCRAAGFKLAAFSPDPTWSKWA